MITTAKCTIFRFDSKKNTYSRFVVPCHWQDKRSDNAAKSGIINADSAMVYIPGKYAEAAPKTPTRDLIIEGEIVFNFPEAASDQELSELMKEFKKLCDDRIRVVQSVEKKLYGSKEVHHIKITAR